jgi:small-conductance mechanosensitive channel
MIKGLRNEMNTVLWKMERSRDMSPEALKNMMKNGLEAMVGAVEKVMNGVSDGLAKERKGREQEEMQREERVKKMEERMVRETRADEGKEKKCDERLTTLEANSLDVEKEVREMAGRMNKDRKETEKETARLTENIETLEEILLEERKVREDENRKIKDRIKGMEEELRKERKNRELLEKEMEMDTKVKEVMGSEKAMERKVEAAMEQMKILDLDFGRECNERKQLVKDAVKNIKGKISSQDREECDRIFKGTKVYILGGSTSRKQTRTGDIHTVPVLLACLCRSDRERLEKILRKAGLHVSFQWPKEILEFVNDIREEIEKMGYERKAFFTRLRPTLVDGRVYIRAECRKKEGGKFEQLACWRLPPLDRDKWQCITGIMEPEWSRKIEH